MSLHFLCMAIQNEFTEKYIYKKKYKNMETILDTRN